MLRTTRAPLLAVPLALVTALLLAGCGALPEREAAPVDLATLVPTAENPDPSVAIDGVEGQVFQGAQHVGPQVRVAYTFTPPIGGTHDQAWAACDGVVYDRPVRSENMVHSLEHGAVWIAYDPEQIDDAGVAALAARVEGQQYMLLSPYPGMDAPVSLQSWGHQLALDDVDDPRIEHFVAALRVNRYTHPEPGASCEEVGRGYFSRADPPAFAPKPDASDVDGQAVVPE